MEVHGLLVPKCSDFRLDADPRCTEPSVLGPTTITIRYVAPTQEIR
jgi:hypothetical protein